MTERPLTKPAVLNTALACLQPHLHPNACTSRALLLLTSPHLS